MLSSIGGYCISYELLFWLKGLTVGWLFSFLILALLKNENPFNMNLLVLLVGN